MIKAITVAVAAFFIAGAADASTLKIRQYTRLGVSATGGSSVQVAQEPGRDMTAVTFTGTPGSSAAFASDATIIAIIADVQFCYSVGKSPTADTTMIYVPAATLMYIGITGGDKISAIACP
jgi:hypothetical protein